MRLSTGCCGEAVGNQWMDLCTTGGGLEASEFCTASMTATPQLFHRRLLLANQWLGSDINRDRDPLLTPALKNLSLSL
jgi:hypothetical protein